MKNASQKPVFPDMLRGRLTTKNGTNLLILMALITALLATSTAAFASSRGGDDNGLARTIPLPNKTSPKQQSTPLQEITMQDKTHGWVLTDTSVLKTSDGGQHWKNVTPSNSAITQDTVSWLGGTFMNQNVAWVVGETFADQNMAEIGEKPTVLTQHTIDGGNHWQSTLLPGNFAVYSAEELIGPPHFINMQEGWLDVQGYLRGAIEGGTLENDLFHTTDGGLHWNILGTEAPLLNGTNAGISVQDAHNIWETVDPETSMNGSQEEKASNYPVAFVSHDGAKTWQEQDLPPIPGLVESQHYTAAPPTFFGNYGLMLVNVTPMTSLKSHLSIYVTNDGGVHWSSGAQTPFEVDDNLTFAVDNYLSVFVGQVDILDRQHIWVQDSDGNIHASQDGGKSWNTLASIQGTTPKLFTSLQGISFTDTNTGWITTDGSSQLLHTTDGGHTWRPIIYSIQ